MEKGGYWKLGLLILKALDFFYQAAIISWIYVPLFLGKISGQGLLVLIIPFLFLLPYQILSSLLIFSFLACRQALNKLAWVRLLICLMFFALWILVFFANKNCMLIEDILTFSTKRSQQYIEYYQLHKGESFVSTPCVHFSASNDILARETISLLIIVPVLFLLTLVDRVREFLKTEWKDTAQSIEVMKKGDYWKLSLSILKVLDFLYQAFLISSIYQIFIGNLRLHTGMIQGSGYRLAFLSLFILAWQVSSNLIIALLGICKKNRPLSSNTRE